MLVHDKAAQSENVAYHPPIHDRMNKTDWKTSQDRREANLQVVLNASDLVNRGIDSRAFDDVRLKNRCKTSLFRTQCKLGTSIHGLNAFYE